MTIMLFDNFGKSMEDNPIGRLVVVLLVFALVGAISYGIYSGVKSSEGFKMTYLDKECVDKYHNQTDMFPR
jgi:hypothetical protein